MITGHTRLFGIIADPVAQLRTPELFNALFAARGIDAALVPIHLAAADLAPAWPGLRAMRNLAGFVVTMPHKTQAASLCDALGETGRLVGAVNVVRREPTGALLGENFDGAGFVAGLRGAGHDPAGRRVLLLGAGGAAKAIAFALLAAGVSRLVVSNRTAETADRLAAALVRHRPDATAVAGAPEAADIVVNATSLGMRPEDPLPIEPSALPPGALVAEVVIRPDPTAFLVAAAARGHPTHAGRHMLDAQLALMADFLRIDAEPGRA